MATATGNSIMARARTIATQTMTDPNVSVVIDSLGGLRALLNNAIRELYRTRSNDQKFIRDIVTRHTVVIAGGEGACPDEIMREMLSQSQFQTDDGALITYFNYNIDQDSGTTYDSLGYVCMQGNNFKYRAPSPDFDAFSGNLYVTAPSFPTFPVSMASNITFPSATTIDDVVLTLARMITGN